MENNFSLNLSIEFIEKLQQYPEKGMGYQIVDIELMDGTILRDKVVLNCTVLKLQENEKIEMEDIKNIYLK